MALALQEMIAAERDVKEPRSIGQRVRELRQAKGWSLDRLASEARLEDGTSLARGTIWEMEKWPTRIPWDVTLRALAGALGVPVEYLRDGRMPASEATLADFPPEAYGRARGIKNPRHLHLIGELFAEFEQQEEHD